MDQSVPARVTVDRRVPLLIFGIIPLLFMVGMYDFYLNDAAWLPYLGLSSLFLPLYLLFFELPHIISSYVSFFDREYVRFYARHLFVGLPLILAAFAGLLWLNIEAAIVLYLIATTYHVLRQQTGIVHLYGVPKSRSHQLWSVTAIIVSSLMYLAVVAPQFVIPSLLALFDQITVLLLCVFCGAGGVLALKASAPGARLYIGATCAMLVSSYVLISLGYVFLAIFTVRFIHDVTAFLFYITHEMNRNQASIKNWLYRLVPFIPKSLMVVVPALGIGIGLALRETITDAEALFVVIMLLAMIHYYLESVMWKRGSLHRQYVSVS